MQMVLLLLVLLLPLMMPAVTLQLWRWVRGATRCCQTHRNTPRQQ
jgi:hypothetical protein